MIKTIETSTKAVRYGYGTVQDWPPISTPGDWTETDVIKDFHRRFGEPRGNDYFADAVARVSQNSQELGQLLASACGFLRDEHTASRLAALNELPLHV